MGPRGYKLPQVLPTQTIFSKCQCQMFEIDSSRNESKIEPDYLQGRRHARSALDIENPTIDMLFLFFLPRIREYKCLL